MRDDQIQIRDALMRRLSAAPAGAVWRAFVEAGVAGYRVCEELGGLGLPVAECEPVMEAIGERCVGAPFLETSIVAAGLLSQARSPAADGILRAMASGEAIVAIGGLEQGLGPNRVTAVRGAGGDWRLQGRISLVLDAMAASFILVPAHTGNSPGVFILEAGSAGMAMRAVPTIDGRMAADITFSSAPVATGLQIDVTRDRLDAVLDEATAAVCVEGAALMRSLTRDTVEYARTRQQFGQPIGSFQAVQHRLVDMNIQTRRAAAISHRAILALTAPQTERRRAVSAAKVTVAKAGRFVGQNAVQLHGGMGMTEELWIGRGFKRLTVIEAQLGGVDHHLRRFMAQAG
jgi:alkylation response protein AidB-like acyl-CoA dehydrogenase